MSKNVTFSANQLAFIDWKSKTKYERAPVTQALLADKLGVNTKTLGRWNEKEEIREAILKRAQSLLFEDLPEIKGALRREAAKGSAQHIKLLLEIIGEYTPTSKHEHTGKNGEELVFRVVRDG